MDEEWGVYATPDWYRAEQWRGPEGLVTLARDRALAESLAVQYNEEGMEMAKSKKANGAVKAPKKVKKANGAVKEASIRNNERLPGPGSILRKTYKGKEYEVKVLSSGLVYEDKTYSSLSAVALKITGYKTISGFTFFKSALEEKGA